MKIRKYGGDRLWIRPYFDERGSLEVNLELLYARLDLFIFPAAFHMHPIADRQPALPKWKATHNSPQLKGNAPGSEWWVII